MKMRKILAFACVVILLLSSLGGVCSSAAPDDTVYVKKHISLVYDNSGSMKMELEGTSNLKWTYASYAAQAFAALLNDTDTLDITFMREGRGKENPSMSLDMSGNRQAQVDKLLNATKTAESDTPWSAVTDAVNKLVKRGLLSDAQIGDNEVNKNEQYWLVLTTDGVFEDTPDGKTVDVLIEELLKKYSNLQVVYFGIGTKGDSSKYSAKDLSKNAKLNAYSNFTAAFAEHQDQIVATMQTLANRVSGRYSVTEGLKINGTTVTLRISGESSPIRNIAILAQETDAKLVSAKDSKGNALKIVRNATINYPKNKNYDNVADSVKGGYAALITSDSGKIAPGTVTLAFSKAVNANKFSLMYEPAVYVDITVETKDENGEWVAIPHGQKIDGGKPVRIGYAVCEDGTNVPIDPSKLPGESSVQMSCGDQDITAGETLNIPAGNTSIKATVSLMDGAYTVSAVRNIVVISLDGYTYEMSDPLEFYPDEIATNTAQYIDFKILYEGKAATADQVTEFTVDGGELQGKLTTPKAGVFRFTPSHANCPIGEYPIKLCFQGRAVATQTVKVKEEVITYSAVAGEGLALFSNQVSSNTTPVIFTVTKHRGEEQTPLIAEDAGLFRAEAKTKDGATLKGTLTFAEGGELHFTPGDNNAAVGSYEVSLYWADNVIATANINILQYDAAYTAEVFTIGDGKVDRFKLWKNKSGLAFVIYADGEPCTGVQLESMLNGVLSLERSPKNKGAKLKMTVGEYDGKAAILVVPGGKGRTAFGSWLRNLGVICGSVRCGDFDIGLTVNAPKGTTATGTLTVYQHLIDWLLWFFIPLLILGLIVFILRVLYCNKVRPKIAAGTMYYYTAEKAGDIEYSITLQNDYYHKTKFRPFLWKKPEEDRFIQKEEKKLDLSNVQAQSGYSRPAPPRCTVTGTVKQLSSYYFMTNQAFHTIEFLSSNASTLVTAYEFEQHFNGIQMFRNLKTTSESENVEQPMTFSQNKIIYQKESAEHIKIWYYVVD